MILRNYIQISQKKGKKERPTMQIGIFCQNLAYTLEYSSFKNNILLDNESILEINYYYRTRGKVCFTESPEIINTLSNQDFARSDKFNKLENLFLHTGVA